MIDKSLFRKLLFSYMITVLLGLLVVGLSMSYLAKDYIMNAKTEEIVRKAKKVNLSIHRFNVVDDDVKSILAFLDQLYDARIWLFDLEGNRIASSSLDEVSTGKSIGSVAAAKIGNGEDVILGISGDGSGMKLMTVAVPWGKDDQIYGGIVFQSPVIGIQETVRNIRESIVWVSLIGFVLSAGVASYVSWSITRPLHQEQVRLDFLANASHELRTPLTAMQGFLEALMDGLIDEEGRQKYYDIIYNETLHMNRLVDDIMDLSRLENNDIKLSRHPVDVGILLAKTQNKFAQEAKDNRTEITLQVHDNLAKAYADPDRLEQIANNIVKNAVKFTEDGRISITAGQVGSYVRICVSDTGAGISPDDIESIWNRFFKADRGATRKNKGSGLGLAIVKLLVELHEGKIEVHSDLGTGTTFTVWIPSIEDTAQ